MSKAKKPSALDQARAERDAAVAKVSDACAGLVEVADRVVERLRKRTPKAPHLRLVKKAQG